MHRAERVRSAGYRELRDREFRRCRCCVLLDRDLDCPVLRWLLRELELLDERWRVLRDPAPRCCDVRRLDDDPPDRWLRCEPPLFRDLDEDDEFEEERLPLEFPPFPFPLLDPLLEPSPGNFRLTADRTFDFSSGEPCWLTRESAFRAWLRSWIGYRRPGSAKSPDEICRRPRAVSRAMLPSYFTRRACPFTRIHTIDVGPSRSGNRALATRSPWS